MVAGAAYVPLGVRRIILSVFSFYASAPANDISRSAHSLRDSIFSKISFPLGRRVGFEDGTIVWKSVSMLLARRLLPRKRGERGEYIKTRDEVSSYVTIMAGVGREQFHVRS